jgi:hypothetical protein
VFTYLAHSSYSSDIARSRYNGLQHTITLSLILVQKVAKLMCKTQVKLKAGALLLDYMYGPDGVRSLSKFKMLSKIQMVHASYDISKLL